MPPKYPPDPEPVGAGVVELVAESGRHQVVVEVEHVQVVGVADQLGGRDAVRRGVGVHFGTIRGGRVESLHCNREM